MRFPANRSPIIVLLLASFLPAEEPAREAPAPRERPFLGLQIEPRAPKDPQSPLVVVYVFPGSAAQEMGFQLGDEVRTLNDILITDPMKFRSELAKENVNARIRVQIRRDGKDMRIEGRMGNYEKTMKAYQESLRTALGGKPLPPLPAAVWWNPATKAWDEKPNALDDVKGKVTVVFSFDGCDICQKDRLQKMSQMKTLFSSTGRNEPLQFIGIFYDSKTGKEDNLKSAAAIFEKSPPVMPMAVAYFPGGKPAAAELDRQFLIQYHGVTILDTGGNISFLQIHGIPELEFVKAYQQALQKVLPGSADGKKG